MLTYWYVNTAKRSRWYCAAVGCHFLEGSTSQWDRVKRDKCWREIWEPREQLVSRLSFPSHNSYYDEDWQFLRLPPRWRMNLRKLRERWRLGVILVVLSVTRPRRSWVYASVSVGDPTYHYLCTSRWSFWKNWDQSWPWGERCTGWRSAFDE